MRRLVPVALVMMLAAMSASAQCPFNIPIKTLAPHTMNGYSWGTVIRPQGDACISHIAVDPLQSSWWYAGGHYGLYMTKTNGASWTKPLNGRVGALLFVPGNGITVPLIYVGIGKNLYLSRDNGQIWTQIKTFTHTVTSILVSEGKLYVGLGWSNHVDPSGVYISNLGGGGTVFKPFGGAVANYTGLIVWTLSRDEQNDILYAGTEIYDHPQPYSPPFFRTANDGTNWTNVNAANALPWHVVESAVRPGDGYVYALTEGSGVYGSATMGSSWTPPSAPALSPGLGCSLLMDPQLPTRLYAGRQETPSLNGGLWLSNDSGKTFKAIGLQDVTVADMALDGNGTLVYAATYGSGIYVSVVP